MAQVRPLFIPPPYQDSAESGRLILRDGTTAAIRLAQPDDCEALRVFFERLSPESRYERFLSAGLPPVELIDTLCNSTDPRVQLTLIVLRTVRGETRIVGTGSYLAKDQETAEVALAVEDAFQGKGVGSILFERLALLAIRHGFVRFWALTHAENRPMMEIFHHSGFKHSEKPEGGTVEVDLSVIPTEASVAHAELQDRLFTAASLRPFFKPRAVAVVGASRDLTSIGYRVLDALVTHHFQGPVYPVNPKASVVGSIRAYPSVRDLPEAVDLAIIVVPAAAVLSVVDDCAARGVRALVVISAGFAESGEEGRLLQRRLVEKARGYGMRLVGPNCMGVMNTDPSVQLNASFSPVFPLPGKVAMSSQSGALGIAVLGMAHRIKLGLSSFVSVGNKADVSGNDLLQYWEQDPATGVILFYLESFGNPRRFSRIARRVGRAKPIVVVKAGRTQAGVRAAGSHTAALAVDDAAVDALFRQTGTIRADTLEEVFNLAALLANQPLPAGRRVAIVTNAGGPGILCADACETGGLKVAEFPEDTKKNLAAFLPASAGLSNPVDMIASAPPEHYQKTIAAVLGCPENDALIILYTVIGVADTDAILRGIASGIREGRSAGGAGKPVLVCWMGEQGLSSPIQVDAEQIPVYQFPEAAARSLSKAAGYAEWRAKPLGRFVDFKDADPEAAREICRRALKERKSGWLATEEVRELLLAMGLPIAPGGVARTPEEAVDLARKVGFPVVVKLASHKILHKTDQGAVFLNLPDEAAVRRAFEQIREPLARSGRIDAMEGALVQPMVTGGVEVMAGVVQDPLFGPLLAFGLGGIHIEILKDVCFRVTPLTDRDAKEMVRSIRGYQLLEGYRGHPPADVGAIEEILLRLSLLVEDVPEIAEIDLNPFLALPPGQGCRIVDARIRVGPASK